MEETDKWAVEVLFLLQEINQKLGFLVQGMEGQMFPMQTILAPTDDGQDQEEVIEYVDDPVTLKALDGSDMQALMSNIEATSPKTAKAIRIARALNEPFQAYVMNPEGHIGIIVGDGTKAHIERLRSTGQWV